MLRSGPIIFGKSNQLSDVKTLMVVVPKETEKLFRSLPTENLEQIIKDLGEDHLEIAENEYLYYLLYGKSKTGIISKEIKLRTDNFRYFMPSTKKLIKLLYPETHQGTRINFFQHSDNIGYIYSIFHPKYNYLEVACLTFNESLEYRKSADVLLEMLDVNLDPIYDPVIAGHDRLFQILTEPALKFQYSDDGLKPR